MTDLATLAIKVDSSEVPKGTTALEGLANSGGKAEAGVKRASTATEQLQAVLRSAIDAIQKNTASNQALELSQNKASSAAEKMARAATAQVQALRASSGAGTEAKAALDGLAVAEARAEALAEQLARSEIALATAMAGAKASAEQLAAAEARMAAEMQDAVIAARSSAEAQLSAAAAMGRAEGAAQRLTNATAQTSQALGQWTNGGTIWVANAKRMEQASDGVTAATAAQKQGMQQLGYQLGDMATMYSMGAKPAQIFSSQIGQITQAVQLMTGGTSKLAAFLGGPWGISLSVAVIALAPLVGKLLETKDALDDVGKAATDAMAKLNASLSQASAMTDAATASTTKLVTGLAGVAKANREIAEIEASQNKSQGFRLIQARQARDAAQKSVDEARADLSNLKSYAAAQAMQAANQEKLNKAVDAGSGSRKKLTDAEREANRLAKAAETQLRQSTEAAQSYADQLTDQAAKFGKSAIEIQRMEVAAKAAAAPTAQLAQRIREAGQALEELQLAKATEDFDRMITKIYDEIELSAMVGKERELRALALEKESKMAEWAAQGLTDLNNKWMQYAAARLSGIEQQSALDRDAKAAEKLADELNRVNQQFADMVNAMQSLPGIGGALGGFLQGLHTGDFSNLGAIGGLLNIGVRGGDDYRKQADLIAGRLEDVFGISGPFAKTLGSVLQGAGTGALVAGVVGNGSTGSQIGGLVGGALGQQFGGQVIGAVSGKLLSSLGAAAGPIGAIAGAILGSVVGGLFKGGPDWATTNLSTGASGGNKDQQRTGVSQAVGAFDQALQQIASQLGATVGNFNTSIGLHNGNWHVSTDGRTGVLRSSQANVTDFKGDSAAALKFAIQDAISDGVFEGLSDGVMRLLKGEGDLETQLQKALSFQGVFDELESLKDPQGYALKQLDKWRSGMDAIFTEAGATADELAKLEELTGLKRKEIVEKYGADIATAEEIVNQRRAIEVQIMDLLGDSQGVLNAARQAEKEATDASLHSLLDRRNALQDEAAATEAGNRILALQIRLSRAQGDEATAKALENMQELNSAQTEQERQMLRMIHETDRLMEQQQQAAEATNMFANMIQSVADAAYKASAELRSYANQIFDEATQSDPTVLMGQIQAAMKAGNTAVLPELIKAYLPHAESQSGSQSDYMRQLAYLRQGSLNAADLADAHANQSANAWGWYMRRMQETGGQGSWSTDMPEGFYQDQANLSAVVASKLDRVAELLERQNAIGADQVVELQTQTSTIDDAFNGGAGVVVLEPAA